MCMLQSMGSGVCSFTSCLMWVDHCPVCPTKFGCSLARGNWPCTVLKCSGSMYTSSENSAHSAQWFSLFMAVSSCTPLSIKCFTHIHAPGAGFSVHISVLNWGCHKGVASYTNYHQNDVHVHHLSRYVLSLSLNSLTTQYALSLCSRNNSSRSQLR